MGLTDTEARLTEAIVILKLMYEDLVRHNLETKSRQMANNFLYGAQLTEWKQELDRKLNFYTIETNKDG